jgi:hypothetical protein
MPHNEKSHRITSEIQTVQTHDVAGMRARTVVFVFVFVFRTFMATAGFTFKAKYKKRTNSYKNSLAEE